MLKPLGDRVIIELVEQEEKNSEWDCSSRFCERKTTRR